METASCYMCLLCPCREAASILFSPLLQVRLTHFLSFPPLQMGGTGMGELTGTGWLQSLLQSSTSTCFLAPALSEANSSH